MKKCVALILLAFLLAGCGNTEEVTVNKSDEKVDEVAFLDVEKVGKIEPSGDESVMYVYNVEGKVKIIPSHSYESEKDKGWYDKPVTKVFSKNGKSKVVPTEDIPFWGDRDEWDIYITVHSKTGETKSVLSQYMFEEQENGWYVDPRFEIRNTPLEQVEYSPNGTNISLSQACQIAKEEADEIFEYDAELRKTWEVLGFNIEELHEPSMQDYSPGAYLIGVSCFDCVEFFSVNKTTGYVFHCGGGQDYWSGMVAF